MTAHEYELSQCRKRIAITYSKLIEEELEAARLRRIIHAENSNTGAAPIPLDDYNTGVSHN
jgi:hypothetical protein